MAIGIAYRAIQNGFEARFTTAATLIEELSNAARTGRLAELLHAYTHPHVRVIDEIGYLSLRDNAANVLFQVVERTVSPAQADALHHQQTACSMGPRPA